MLQSPTTPRFQNSGEGGGLAVPGSDAKSQKSKRRESSMMFMKGLKSPMFGPPKGNNTSKFSIDPAQKEWADADKGLQLWS